jgi:hypothetical protein
MWSVFFGLLLAALFIVDPEDAPLIAGTKFKLIYIACYILFLAFLYFTVIPLKRIDTDGDYLYVSNYFKTYRYKFTDLESIKESNYALFKTLKFRLKSKGSLGQSFTILADEFRVNLFIKEHPEALKGIL